MVLNKSIWTDDLFVAGSRVRTRDLRFWRLGNNNKKLALSLYPSHDKPKTFSEHGKPFLRLTRNKNERNSPGAAL